MDGAIFLNHRLLYLSKLKDSIWTVRFNPGFKSKTVLDDAVLTFGFLVRRSCWTIQSNLGYSLKDRVGRCSLTLDKLKDRVLTIQFNLVYLSKLKDRVWTIQFNS